MTHHYTIEGEQLTLQQIIKRCPGVNRHTVRRRLDNGWRTWERLRAAAGAMPSASPWGQWQEAPPSKWRVARS